MKNKILLVDGSSYLYRAFHTPSLSRLTTPSGELSGTVFGFNRSLNFLLEHHKPTHCCIVFDPRGKTVRSDFFPQYKANRPATPIEIVNAYAQVEALLSVRSIKHIQVKKQEADDVLGSISAKLSTEENLILIASGDKDLAQLVTKNTHLTDIKKGKIETYDKEGIKEKMGIYPEQVADYLALMGDAVDNIPGIQGVGVKTAIKLINEYGNMEGIVENINHISGKIGTALTQQQEEIPLYLKLTQIDCQIPLEIEVEDLLIKADKQQEALYYENMGFVTELSKIKRDGGADSEELEKKEISTEEIKIKESAEEWINNISQELTSSDQQIFLLQNKEYVYAVVLPQKRILGISKAQTKKIKVKELQKEIAQKIELKIYAYDWKELWYDANIMPMKSHSIDLKLCFYLLYAGKVSAQWKSASKELGRLMQNNNTPSTELNSADDIIKIAEQYQYLQKKFTEELKASSKIKFIYEQIEVPLEKILVNIEEKGVYINEERLIQIDIELSQKINETKEQIYKLSKEPFNIDSPKQVGEILYHKLNLPILQKTATGAPSTNEETLQKLALNGHEIAQQIIKYRGLAKLQSTYTKGLLKHITEKKRIHTKLNQTVTATGRLSSSEPNLQNIPIRTESGRAIRKAFCAPPGKLLMAADYSQIELRILAHETQDEKLISAFKQGLDIHKVTAASVFKQSEESITSEQRRYAKTINFGLIYGMSSFSLSNQLKISMQDAKEWVENYFKQFPKILEYMESIKKGAREKEYVSSLMGRRIHVPDINNRNFKLRGYAERAAINAPIQGAAADLIKLAMIKVYEITEQSDDIDIVLQIHDELLFEVEESRADYYQQKIRETMQNVMPLSVPLDVEIGVAKSWDEAH